MRKLGVLLVVLWGSVLLAGCGGGGSESDSGSAPSGAGAPAVAEGFGAQAPNRQQAPAPPDSGDAVERKEVVTGNVALTADDPIAAAETLTDRVTRLDGRIDQRTENPGTEDSEPKAELVVRIPAAETESFLDGLGDLGELTEISTDRDDVTMQWEDLDARITALRASVDRLRDLMANATNTADLLAAEDALAERQADLDSLTGRLRHLDDQIDLSTLTIEITSVAEKTGDTGPKNFWDGVVDGWHSLVDWLKGAVVFIGQALPWLGFVAVAGAIIGGIVQLVRGRRGPRAPQSAPAATETRAEAEQAPTATTDESSSGESDERQGK